MYIYKKRVIYITWETKGDNLVMLSRTLRKSSLGIWGLALFAILFTGCLAKAPLQTDPIVEASVASPAPVAAEVVQKDPDQSETSYPSELIDFDEEEIGDLDSVAADTTARSSDVLDGQELLDTALETTQIATDLWRKGDQDEALASLDSAYEVLLQIPDEDKEGVLQGKENLRLMISKRIVEIYASRRTSAGSMERAIPIVINAHVEREIKSFQTRERTFFLESYVRSGRFRPMILEALRREGMPEQLSWLPLIESGFKTGALSRARALGIWQFIPSTGYRYGLNRNQWVDERMDPVKATEGAIAYLHELHEMFGDWLSSLAGYNCGEGRVMRAINSQRINYLDDFWDVYQKLPRETARYVPRFLATLIILENPEKYGFELPPLAEEDAYTTIEINRAVQLSDLDRIGNVDSGTFHKLNPELRYKVTPNTAYQLKAPASSVEMITAGISSIAQWSPPADANEIHRVTRGQTLSSIAKKYRTTVSKIMAANNLRNRHRLSLGQRLKIPGRGRPVLSKKNSTASSASKGKNVQHVVKAGDSLWMLARKYNTSVDKIRQLNKMTNSNLHLGQKLTMSPGKNAKSDRTYRVRSGDTLAKIAQSQKVRLGALLLANNLSRSTKIFPNQTLIIP